ncbi:hypothetical protein J6590_019215 [Homalodisca vitripennis]|nr:hypothetical protein J6590_019215 [Homalodisca vitripennis]
MVLSLGVCLDAICSDHINPLLSIGCMWHTDLTAEEEIRLRNELWIPVVLWPIREKLYELKCQKKLQPQSVSNMLGRQRLAAPNDLEREVPIDTPVVSYHVSIKPDVVSSAVDDEWRGWGDDVSCGGEVEHDMGGGSWEGQLLYFVSQ